MPVLSILLASFGGSLLGTPNAVATEDVDLDPLLNTSASSQCMSRLGQECFTSCGQGMTCSRGRCYCDWGTCAGLDGQCYTGQYLRLPGSYKLTNAQWPEYYMIQRGLGRTEVADFGKLQYSEFSISIVHGPSNGGVAILLRPKEQLDYAVAMTDMSGSEYLKATRLGASTVIEDAVSLLYKPPRSDPHSNATMVMIRGRRHPAFAYAYIPRVAKAVFGHKGDKGAGMYWYISPPLPESVVNSMHEYTGELCKSGCGDVDAISGATQGVATIAMLLVGSYVLTWI